MQQSSTFRVGRALAVCGLLLACGSVDPEANTPGGTDNPGGRGGAAGEPGGGADAGASAGGAPSDAAPLLPWAVGNAWTYRITKNGVVSLKTTTIGELESVGGQGPNAELMANHVTTAKGGDKNDHSESWQLPSSDGQRVARYREQSFDASTGKLSLDEYWTPEKLHIDGSSAHATQGAVWFEQYQETKLVVGAAPTTHDVRERWTVLEDDATLEVPAGTFEHTLHFQKLGGSSTKEYWYARGVGKLKETGTQTEELTEYHLEATP